MLARRALVTALLVAPAVAGADQFVYSAFAGGGAGVHFERAAEPRASGCLFLESVFGITDSWNLEAPLIVEFGSDLSGAVGIGGEYVYFHNNHWRLDVGAGLGLRYAWGPPETLRLVPYVKSAVRWLFAWGVGASLSVHVASPVAASPTLVVYPSLSLYQEFW